MTAIEYSTIVLGCDCVKCESLATFWDKKYSKIVDSFYVHIYSFMHIIYIVENNK